MRALCDGEEDGVDASVSTKQSLDDLDPGRLLIMGGQGKHAAELVAPCVLLYVPAGQALHVVVGGKLQNPMGQQTPAVGLLNVPWEV